MQNKNIDSKLIHSYLALTYFFLLLNGFVFLRQIESISFIQVLFTIAVYLSYNFLYLLPIILVLEGLKLILARPLINKQLTSRHVDPNWFLYIPAVLLTWFLQVLIFTDGFIFRFYGFHINGFVLNLVFTPGGIESMGGNIASFLTFGAIFFAFLVLQIFLLAVLLKIKSIRIFCFNFFNSKRLALSGIAFLILIILQGFTYGLSKFYAYTPVLTTADAFPLYVPIVFNDLARSIGLEAKEQAGFQMETKNIQLRYPLAQLTETPKHRKYNIVWLVGESLRADMLDPEIMPQTWAFSKKAVRFMNHYGSSNTTRYGLFSMFYGLYGNYWFSFLNEHKGPIIMDVLMREGYQIDIFTSADFNYPEFAQTIFAHIPRKLLHDKNELAAGAGWQHDRENVTRMVDFLDKRQPGRPFMTFMFFESPHARYYFPDESVIRKPYLEVFNYATMDLKSDIGLIKNRYINSCHHLDSQYGRILEYLKTHGLLDSTIVILTGDHGEEFMEKGHWGHGSAFVEEQTRVPMVLWVPGMAPREVNNITAHLDIPATLLPLLGITTPAEKYTLGINLLGAKNRQFTVLSDWYTLVYVDDAYKAAFNYNGISTQKVTTKDDMPVKNPEKFYQDQRRELFEILRNMTKFSK